MEWGCDTLTDNAVFAEKLAETAGVGKSYSPLSSEP
jgi:hypothetical protein